MSRGLLPFVLALVAGAGLGLYLGWVVSPVQYVDTEPPSLRQDYKDDYVLMIATLYARDGDLVLARARLVGLGYADPGSAAAATAERFLAALAPRTDLQRLARLAAALNSITPPLQPYLQ